MIPRSKARRSVGAGEEKQEERARDGEEEETQRDKHAERQVVSGRSVDRAACVVGIAVFISRSRWIGPVGRGCDAKSIPNSDGCPETRTSSSSSVFCSRARFLSRKTMHMDGREIHCSLLGARTSNAHILLMAPIVLSTYRHWTIYLLKPLRDLGQRAAMSSLSANIEPKLVSEAGLRAQPMAV